MTQYLPEVTMVVGPRFSTFEDLGLVGYERPEKTSRQSDKHSADLHVAFEHSARLAVEVVCTAVQSAEKKLRHYVWSMQMTPLERWADLRVLFVACGDLTTDPGQDEVTGRAALYRCLADAVESIADAELRARIGQRIGITTYREFFPARHSASRNFRALECDVYVAPSRWERRSFAATIPGLTSGAAADALRSNGQALGSVSPALQGGEQPSIVLHELGRVPELSHHFFGGHPSGQGAASPKRLHRSVIGIGALRPVITADMLEGWFQDAFDGSTLGYFCCPIDHSELSPEQLRRWHRAGLTGYFEREAHTRWTREQQRSLSLVDLLSCAISCRPLHAMLVYDVLLAVHGNRSRADMALLDLHKRLRLKEPVEALRNTLDLTRVLDKRTGGQFAYALLDDTQLAGRHSITSTWAINGTQESGDAA